MHPEQFELHAKLEDRHWWFTARRRIVAHLTEDLIAPGGSVVDMGCGTGANIAAFADRFHCRGVDVSEDAIRLASLRFPHIDFRLASEPQSAAPADLVLLMDVLEHIEEDRPFLEDAVSRLRPGALVLITVPADRALWSDQDVHHGHFRRYEMASFSDLWSDLPVKVRLLSHYNFYLYPLIRAVRIWNRARGKTFGFAGTDLKLPGNFLNGSLERIFEREGRVLRQLLERRRRRGFPFGVSLLALLQRV